MATPPTKGNGKNYRWLVEHVAYQGDSCLPWPFCKDRRVGRGTLGHNGESWWAHRLMCVLAHGEPPTAKHQAAHNCGKGHYGCVNPRHLEWKTNSQNQLDRAKNGNSLRNSKGPGSVLSDEQKREIVALKGEMAQTAIAAKFGVSLGCVQYWQKYRQVRGHDLREKYAWTKDEVARLRRAISSGEDLAALASEIGRTIGAVTTKINRLSQTNGQRT
jgi:hypothetical protein